ncbi:mechanosensitive ion channel family protein [Flavobacterium selenitireducens]|uniref:mechanosensitive ion channel family protein n=1 Tax=Flavobacterium selenitireducens TaxID=2722704 RepID=UPI00168A45A7|nr:mechanosensitive ion channel [Flavobacterium selenitireducens]MBD3583219.1 mechanosensitive ion channel [Flavobacterium selenitireducens]
MEFDINTAINLIIDKLSVWGREFVRMLPNIAMAAIVFVIGFFISKLIKRLALRLIAKVSHNVTLNRLFATVVYVFAIGIVLFIGLSVLGLDKAVTSILAGAGILGLALAFAFQDIASNFMSGIFMSFRKPLKVGDVVKLKGYMGKVKEINLRDTVIQTFQGHLITIPNKDVFQNPIENYTTLNKRRFDLDIGVSYGDDLDLVKQVTLDAVKDIPDISKTSPTTIMFREFGDNSINFRVRMWIDSAEQGTFSKVGSEAIQRIKKAYDKAGITIPFPTRTLDFGVKGGVPLSEIPIMTQPSTEVDDPEDLGMDMADAPDDDQ